MKKSYCKPATIAMQLNTKENILDLSKQGGEKVTGNEGWDMYSREEEDWDNTGIW